MWCPVKLYRQSDISNLEGYTTDLFYEEQQMETKLGTITAVTMIGLLSEIHGAIPDSYEYYGYDPDWYAPRAETKVLSDGHSLSPLGWSLGLSVSISKVTMLESSCQRI